LKGPYDVWITENVEDPRYTCHQWSHAMVAAFPELRLARGYYMDPIDGRRGHWWCVTADGTIVDPTAEQFWPHGEYVELADDEVPTGVCLNCGGDCFHLRAVCSDECGEEATAYYASSRADW